MAHDESHTRVTGIHRRIASTRVPAPMTFDTADPAIDTAVEHPSDRKLHPDATISLETTQVASRTCSPPRESGRSSLTSSTAIHRTALMTRTAEVRIEAIKRPPSRTQIDRGIKKTVAMTDLDNSSLR